MKKRVIISGMNTPAKAAKQNNRGGVGERREGYKRAGKGGKGGETIHWGNGRGEYGEIFCRET